MPIRAARQEKSAPRNIIRRRALNEWLMESYQLPVLLAVCPNSTFFASSDIVG